VEGLLGRGWEGEVYHVIESRTGIARAAKVFFPHRNQRDRAVRFYANKLERLRLCPMVIQYHHTASLRFRGQGITCLISELVEGEILGKHVTRSPGKRLHPFEALHLLHALTTGLEQIHRAGEYHGDLHDYNVLVRRTGIGFDVKLVDFYHWGAPSKANRQEDIIKLVRLFYDVIGGAKRYRTQPDYVKYICCGLKRGMILERYPTMSRLREHLETFEW
jgi:hypothetical protein